MITIQNKPSGIVFSSEFSELTINTNQKQVYVAVQNQGFDYLFYELMWVYGSELKVFDIAGIIEADMREKGRTIANFKISVFSETETESFEVTVLYCESFSTSGISPSSFLQEYFLSSVTERRIPPEASLALYFYDTDTATSFFEANVNYRLVSDPSTIKSYIYHGNTLLNLGLRYFEISLADIRKYIANSLRVSANTVEIVNFSLICGNRYAGFFVDPSLKYGETFIFRNAFNTWDFICLPSLTSENIDTNKSLAVLGTKVIGYDWSVEKSYEVQSGPLSIDEAKLVAQLVSSREVHKLTESGQFFQIVVTDSDCSIKDNDEPQSVKFTWRYADGRPSVSLPSDIVRIFTKQYNKIFS